MNRRALIPVLLLVGSLPTDIRAQKSPPSDRGEQQKPANQKQESPGQSPAQSVMAPDNQTGTRKEEDSAKAQTQQRPEKPPWWDVTWPTWGLVIVGLVAACIALWTLGDIK